MDTVTLKYSSGSLSAVLPFILLRGLDDGDEIQGHNAFMSTSDDGTLYPNVDAFRRVITLDLGVVPVQANRDFVFAWATSKDATIASGAIADLGVVLEDVTKFMNTWLNNVKIGKSYPIRLLEKTAWTSKPW